MIRTEKFDWHVVNRSNVCSMGDLFHEDVPFEYIHRILDIIKACPQHTFLILTKRPQRMAEVVNHIYGLERLGWSKGFWDHVWLGVTAENQARANERIPILLQIPAAIRFVSVEPMLGPVDISKYLGNVPACRVHCPDTYQVCRLHSWECSNAHISKQGIDWVICGGETGPGARPMHPDWVRSLRDQCQAAGVPFFLKQWGEWGYNLKATHALNIKGQLRPIKSLEDCHSDWPCAKLGKKKAGRILDGRTWDEMPPINGR